MTTAIATQTTSRTFSINFTDNSHHDSRYHLTSHTLHVREWGLEVVADSGEVAGYPWASVANFTLGHTSR